ncbi:MAG: cytochrome c3 family protein [Longimicrobiales bacterium]|nr:cytochrome c3 family protein [Longimicrobiales bacterium]
MGQTLRRLAFLPLSVFGLAILAGCVDEKIVFQERELFEDPLSAANSFLGYTDRSTKLTVCGNCHVSPQGEWEETAHADAWAGLQDSGHAQEFCEGCHTVNELGNPVTEVSGHTATGEERYYDVQCESCHGPGLTHVENPTDVTVPRAPVDVGLDLTQGCGECHSGSHHPFVEEWALSDHGSPNPYPQGRSACEGCHTGEGALEAFAPNTTYLEQADVEDNTDNNLAITCAVCHDPHGGEFDSQLRFALDEPSLEQNLCMKCHQKRAVPDLGDAGTASRGPHSPQGPLLLGIVGEVGWTPPNFSYNVERIRGTHGSVANERLCAGCHVNSYDISDPESGDFVFTATGHLFEAIPCVDAQGIPQPDGNCDLTVEARSFDSCATSGCHGDEDAALSAVIVARDRIDPLVAELENLLAQVPADQFSNQDTVFTVAEGAEFNAALGAIQSSAYHNPFMTEALLTSSIRAVEDEYGVTASPLLDLRNLLGTEIKPEN